MILAFFYFLPLTLSAYSSVPVLILITSPAFIKSGTATLAPVSIVTTFDPPLGGVARFFVLWGNIEREKKFLETAFFINIFSMTNSEQNNFIG